jgi:hypothetical protein
MIHSASGRLRAAVVLLGVAALAPGRAPLLAHGLQTRPTAVLDETSPTFFTLDGGMAAARWPAEAMPVRFWVNPTNPGPVTPLVVPPGREPAAEFVSTMRRSFAHWTEVEDASVAYRFAGLTDTPAGVFDGKNVVGWSEPEACGFLGGYNIAFTVLFTAPVPEADPPQNVLVWANHPPYTVDFGDGLVFEIRFPGQIIESDTVICSTATGGFSTTRPGDPAGRGTFDLEYLAIHEQGHFGGLLHSPLAGAVMFPTLDFKEGTDDPPAVPSSDDVAGIVQLYPRRGCGATIEGRATVGSLFPDLPVPPPFRGRPLAPGDPAFLVNVVAVNRHGIVEASALSEADGTFALHGLGEGPYTLEVEPVDLGWTDILVGADRWDYLALNPLVYFESQRLTRVRPGRVDLVVEAALPGQENGLGIGDTWPPPVQPVLSGFIQDDPATPDVAELNWEFRATLRRGQRVGSDVPTAVPGVFEGSLAVFVLADAAELGEVSVDLGPDIRVLGRPVVAAAVRGGAYVIVQAKVERRARPGMRNLQIVDGQGRRAVLAGVIEVQR